MLIHRAAECGHTALVSTREVGVTMSAYLVDYAIDALRYASVLGGRLPFRFTGTRESFVKL